MPTTPNVVPASRMLEEHRRSWLDEWSRFAAGDHAMSAADLDQAKLVLLDTVGAIAAGMQEAEMIAFADRMSQGRGGAAAVIGLGRKLVPGTAALLNGTAGTMLELDEGNHFSRGHPAIQVVPALLAVAAGQAISGRRLLEALVLGYELAARIGIASRLRITMHPHGTWGTVGAALTVALLKNADAGMIRRVANIASGLNTATSRRTMIEGATVRNVYSGLSGQMGILAWDLASAGFTGEADGVATVYDGVVADGFDSGEMLVDLGTRWEISRNYFKRHAACRYTHAAVDALQQIMGTAESSLRADSIDSVEVQTYVWAAQLDNAAPTNMLAAKFSLPFVVATTIVNGSAGTESFRGSSLHSAEVRALAARVVVNEDPDLTRMMPQRRPAKVVMTLRNGQRLEATALVNRGDLEAPYSSHEIMEKFHDLASAAWSPSIAKRISEAVLKLDSSSDVAPLLELLTSVREAP